MTETASARPSALWKRMTGAQRLAAAEAFWRDETSSTEHQDAIKLLAERLHFRPKSVRTLPFERRARALASTSALSETLAASLLVAYHLGSQRPMMSTFLDALGIAHNNGLIPEDATPEIDEAKLGDAVERIRAAFPADDVSLYLATLVAQDPETWKGVARLQDTSVTSDDGTSDDRPSSE